MNWKGKRVLVTGSEGMIGRELVEQLLELDVNPYLFDIKLGWDITNKEDIERFIKDENIDYVFHLFGIKGNPKVTKEKPVDFMGPMLQGDTNMITLAQKYGVKRFLYTSSIAVEHPKTDWYPAWAKRTAEELIKAMRIQYPDGTKYCIVRPANVYGRFDDFSNPNSMVITNLISFSLLRNIIKIYGDGNQIRDFINAKDVARGMIQAMEEMQENPVNLCSGKGVSIKKVAEIISKYTRKRIRYFSIENRVMGQNRRVMKLNWDFKPEIKLEDGIKETIEYAKSSYNNPNSK